MTHDKESRDISGRAAEEKSRRVKRNQDRCQATLRDVWSGCDKDEKKCQRRVKTYVIRVKPHE
jgi:hypothetical protein